MPAPAVPQRPGRPRTAAPKAAVRAVRPRPPSPPHPAIDVPHQRPSNRPAATPAGARVGEPARVPGGRSRPARQIFHPGVPAGAFRHGSPDLLPKVAGALPCLLPGVVVECRASPWAGRAPDRPARTAAARRAVPRPAWPRRCAAAAWPPLCTAAAGHGGAPRARPDRIRPSPGVPDPAAREGTPQVPPGGRVRGARACVTALGRVTEPRLARRAGCPGGTPGTAGARGRRRPPRCGRRPRPSAAGPAPESRPRDRAGVSACARSAPRPGTPRAGSPARPARSSPGGRTAPASSP